MPSDKTDKKIASPEGKREEIQLSSELNEAVDNLLEKLPELNEEQLMEQIDNDEHLSQLPLKVRAQILEVVIAYQQKLEGGGMTRKEGKEKKEGAIKIGMGSRIRVKRNLDNHINDEGTIIKYIGGGAYRIKVGICEHDISKGDMEILSSGLEEEDSGL